MGYRDIGTGGRQYGSTRECSGYTFKLIDENKVHIDAVEAIPPLLLLLSEGTLRGKKEAANALFNLCVYEGKEKVVPFLVEAIGSGSSNTKDNVASVLVKLCSRDQKYFVEAQKHGVMGKLMDLLQHGVRIG
ncbi:hypothetical protein L2E82_29727 [Cichorium intybus]|uniref:Uncharacterized protein n=1 Tax=Cichorium intybus TaxID=13427 RepID=A0ACB9CYF3_CICIN|nr:hypothetical protein L2E82_29727 [Cichorium intybus]